jgi:hypothetical protein
MRKDMTDAEMVELNKEKAAELGQLCLDGQQDAAFGKAICGKTGIVQ